MSDIRVGDRFEYGHRKITITGVKDNEIAFAQLDEDDKTIWSLTTLLPLPSDWVLIGREPEPKMLCANCLIVEAEPNSVYCWTCLALHAGEWATLTEEEARFRTISMLAGAADREADKRGESDGDEAEAAGD
jgi:hypothetical protein